MAPSTSGIHTVAAHADPFLLDGAGGGVLGAAGGGGALAM